MSKRNLHGTFLGMPYDWRRPTMERFLSRVWNPEAPIVTERWFGWGYDFNWYAVLFPVNARRARNKRK